MKEFIRKNKSLTIVAITALVLGCATAAKVLIKTPMFTVEIECSADDTKCVTNVKADDSYWVCDFKVSREAVSLEMLEKFCKKIK